MSTCLLCDLVLQRLAGLEDGHGGGGDLDGLAGLGVDALAGIALLRLEGAEAGELDLVARGHGGGDGVKGGEDGLLGLTSDGRVLTYTFRTGEEGALAVDAAAVEIAQSGAHSLVLTENGRVLSFGDSVEVLEPASVREQVKEKLLSLAYIKDELAEFKK